MGYALQSDISVNRGISHVPTELLDEAGMPLTLGTLREELRKELEIGLVDGLKQNLGLDAQDTLTQELHRMIRRYGVEGVATYVLSWE